MPSPSATLGVEHLNLGSASPAQWVDNRDCARLHVDVKQPIRLVPVIHRFGQSVIPLLGVSILVLWIHMDRTMLCIAMNPAANDVRQMLQRASSAGKINVFLQSPDNSSMEFSRDFSLTPQLRQLLEAQSLQPSEKFHQAHRMFVLLGMAKQMAEAISSPEYPIKHAIDAVC